jgi:hypothetical protein
MPPLALMKLLADNPLGTILYGFVLLGAALLGGLLTGVVARYSALLFWKELSWSKLLLLRLTGAIAGAIVAWSLIGTGDGWGFGPGAGGWPGRGPGDGSGVDAQPTALNDTVRDRPTEPAAEPRDGATVRIMILGPETRPPYEEPDRFFQVLGADSGRAMTVAETIDRLKSLRQERSLKEVALEEASGSTVFARPYVHTLRARVLNELRLPFSQPDFDANAPKQRRYYKPAEK